MKFPKDNVMFHGIVYNHKLESLVILRSGFGRKVFCSISSKKKILFSGYLHYILILVQYHFIGKDCQSVLALSNYSYHYKGFGKSFMFCV